MKGQISLIALTLAVSHSAFGSSECVEISDDQRRLSCYDAEYQPAVVSQSVSEWQVSEEASLIDDSKTVVVKTMSLDEISDRVGRSSHANLVLRCHENTTSMYMTFAGNHMTDHQQYGRVVTRVDQTDAVNYSMSVSTDNRALGLWSGSRSIPFIRSMFESETLTVRATPYSESPITVQFPISGLEKAVEPLREACNW